MGSDSRIVRAGPYPGCEGSSLGWLLEDGHEPRVVRIDWLPELSSEDLTRLGRDVARAGDLLHHPNIQAPIALACIDGVYGLVVEWVDGESLKELLDVGGRLPPAIAARLVRDACEALHFAHEEDPEEGPFVHGWLLPDNLLVSRSGVTLVAGFGGSASRAVRDLLPWQSPEQVLGGSGAASRRSDVYGLGLILHACLSGENPFGREPDPEVAILSLPPPSLEPLGVPPALAAVARRALSVKAVDRFKSAEEMGRALDDAATEVAPPAGVAAWTESLFPAGMGLRAARQRAVDAALESARERARAPRPDAAEEVGDEQIMEEPGADRRATPDAPEDLRTDEFQFVAPPFPPPLSSVVGAADIVGEAPPAPPPVRQGRADRAVPPPSGPQGGPAGDAPAGAEAPPAPRRAATFRAAAALAAVGGLGLGWWLSSRQGGGEATHPPAAAPPAPATLAGEVQAPAPALPVAAQARTAEPPRPRPTAGSPAARPTLEVTASEPGDVLLDGKRAGQTPLTRSVRSGRHEVRLVNRNLGLDVVRTVDVESPRTALSIEVGKGRLTVTAPEGAQISLDGRPVGAGRVRDLEIYEGHHQLVVTLGPARHEHRFHVAAKESYEYEVTAGPP
ncbi:MAG TPA: PEGA domain-containing protein [Anaeromyxobacteraceae bacterium]|nr:PEGA domain-containing protein [Anaeromyxobacteraceae bacterium]